MSSYLESLFDDLPKSKRAFKLILWVLHWKKIIPLLVICEIIERIKSW